jgi:hypothetical protein
MNKQQWSERFDEEFTVGSFTWTDTFNGRQLAEETRQYVKSFIQTVEKEAVERVVTVGWVRAAICPQCDGSGAYYDGSGNLEDYSVVQCQWCDERKKLIEALEAPNKDTL